MELWTSVGIAICRYGSLEVCGSDIGVATERYRGLQLGRRAAGAVKCRYFSLSDAV